MTSEFEERLWAQLATAAEREARGGRIRRAAAATLSVRRAAALTAAAAAAAAVLVILVAFSQQPREHQTWRIQQFRVEGREFAASASGFGSLWTYDMRSAALLRVDPRTHRVLARFPLPTTLPTVAVATGAGAVWAVPVEPIRHSAPATTAGPVTLTRIDPRRNGVAARIKLRAPDRSTVRPVDLIVRPDAVWVWGQTEAQRIDPSNNRITRVLKVPDETFAGVVATDAWVSALTNLGRLVTFDAHTGARLGAADVPIASGYGQKLLAIGGAVIVDLQNGTIASIDPTTGHYRWTARVESARDLAATPRRLWILSSTPGRDQLSGLDPETGRTVARITLPAGEVDAITTAGNTILATTEQGSVISVRPR